MNIKKKYLYLLLPALLILFAASALASPKKAPEWVISEWINGPGVTLDELRGKVVVIEFFQLWCPGCNKFSIPLMQKWSNTFRDEIKSSKLELVSIHTVFEGFDYQTPERLRSFVKEKGIKHLVGIDTHKEGKRIPETMKRYQTRGTPEMAVVDKKGFIRFRDFGSFEPLPVEELIRRLINES